MTFKDFFINSKKVKELYINGKKAKIGEHVPEDMLGFKAVNGSVGLRLAKNGAPDAVSLETRLDDGSWNAWDLSEITITQNSTLYVRRTDDAASNTFSKNISNYYKFVTTGTGKVEAQGSIQYLLGKSGTRTDVKPYCYYQLFIDCTSLTHAPKLPATAAGQYVYGNMFKGCTSLTQAPELPATTLAYYCYRGMFQGCTSLTHAPKLPATNLNGNCYRDMFQGCTSLTQAPELPATTFNGDSCYQDMFQGCTSLNSLKVVFTAWGTQTANWLNNVASTGTFICPQALIDATTTRDASTVPAGWTMEPDDILGFKAVGGNASVRMIKTGTPNVTPEFEVSKNYGAWTIWDKDWINLNDGEFFRIRATTSTGSKTSTDFYNYWKFESSGEGNIECFGDLMYLFSKDKSATSLPTAQNLFNGMTKLTKVQLCSANTLTPYSVGQMFNNCTGLTDGPQFNATESGVQYVSMLQAFENCTSLRKVKFPNCSMDFVTNTIAGTYAAFKNAAANIEVVCSDGTIYVNDTQGV